MAIDPEKVKQDPRTSAELAKAILDHELKPGVAGESYAQTFREILWEEYNSPAEPRHLTDVLLSLKHLEYDVPLTRQYKRALSHGLQLIDDYRRSAALGRDRAELQANPHMPPKNRVQQVDLANLAPYLHGPHTEKLQRQGQEEMEEFMLTISNLNAIEKLLRALAHKCGIDLIEHGHCR